MWSWGDTASPPPSAPASAPANGESSTIVFTEDAEAATGDSRHGGSQKKVPAGRRDSDLTGLQEAEASRLKAQIEEKKQQEMLEKSKVPWYIILPEGALCSTRDMASMLALCSLYFTLPYEIAFIDAPNFPDSSDGLYIFNRVIDFIFLVEVSATISAVNSKSRLLPQPAEGRKLESRLSSCSCNSLWPTRKTSTPPTTSSPTRSTRASRNSFPPKRSATASSPPLLLCSSAAPLLTSAHLSSPLTSAHLCSPLAFLLLQERYEFRLPHIFLAYLRGWLLIDILAMVPSAFDIYFASLAPEVDDAAFSAAELLAPLNASDSVPPATGVKASRSVRLVKLVRLARMLKILRLLRLLKSLKVVQTILKPDSLAMASAQNRNWVWPARSRSLARSRSPLSGRLTGHPPSTLAACSACATRS